MISIASIFLNIFYFRWLQGAACRYRFFEKVQKLNTLRLAKNFWLTGQHGIERSTLARQSDRGIADIKMRLG
jgi:hypothetical protein